MPEVFGRYRIQRPLGAGAMGAVYAALDTQLDRVVALKIPFFADNDPDVIDRFYREARAMATLHHPNICPIFDVGAIDGVHYLTMALIEGRPLSEDLKSGQPDQNRQAAIVIRKLALALHSAHQLGIVHRDLKPGNVMINPDHEPVIMDFGLARRSKPGEATLTQAGAIVGTPAYMSPEQVSGNVDQVTPAMDIYALGVMLYQMLTGKLPFTGSLGATLAKILTEEPPPPRSINAAVDAELEAICLKAMSRNAADRYASAADLAADLQRSLEGQNSAAMSEARRPPKRNPSGGRKWVGATIGLVAIAAVITGIVVNNGRKTTPTRSADPVDPSADLAVDTSPPDESWRLPPEPRRYPSLPDAISAPPPWLLADTSAPFDLVEHFSMPIWEDNAAPMYLDALYEFESKLEVYFSEEQRTERTQPAADRGQEFYAVHTPWAQDRQSVTLADVERALSLYDSAFEKLGRAQRKNECRFDPSVSRLSHITLVNGARGVARYAQLRIWHQALQGNLDGAIDDLLVMTRLSRDLNRGGSLVTVLVSIAVNGLSYSSIRDILLHPELTVEQCDRLVAILDEHERIAAQTIELSLRQEYVVFRIELHDIQYHTGEFSPARMAGSVEDPEGDSTPTTPGEVFASGMVGEGDAAQSQVAERINAMNAADFAREITIADEGYRSLLSVFDLPVHEQHGFVSRLRDQLARNPESRIFRYKLPILLQVFVAYRRDQASLAGLRCLTCLRRWQISHADVPPDLEAILLDAGITEPCLDPYGGGEPMRFAVIDGEPVIYSVGEDGYDEQGLVEWNLHPGVPGDITFRLETQAELELRRGTNQ